jgi:bacterioferritin-associated ferredoxin
MYVCICKAVTQKQLEEKAQGLRGNMAQAIKSLGVGSQCGSCLEESGSCPYNISNSQSSPLSNHSFANNHSLKANDPL